MKDRGSGIKIVLAIAGFMVLTTIFFGSTLIIFDYLVREPKILETERVIEKSDQEMDLERDIIPQYDSYNFLGDHEKIAYQKIVDGLAAYKKKISVNGVDTNEIEKVLVAIDNDHPEIFWVAELAYYFNEYSDEVSQVEVKYDYDESQKEVRQQAIDKAYAEYSGGIKGNMDEYEIVKYTYEYVVKNTVYGENNEDQNIYSVFGLKESVCAGYAKAVKYLLDRQEIECSYVAGFVETQGAHAWNLVSIDSDYYYLDPTWGELDGDNHIDADKNISYDYFCVTTKVLELTHAIDTMIVNYPDFTAVAANYFVRENRLYDLANDREKIRLKNDLVGEMNEDEKYFYFAVRDQAMMETAEILMDEILGNYTFFVDERLRTFTITLY